jgi:hypothetical protein
MGWKQMEQEWMRQILINVENIFFTTISTDLLTQPIKLSDWSRAAENRIEICFEIEIFKNRIEIYFSYLVYFALLHLTTRM